MGRTAAYLGALRLFILLTGQLDGLPPEVRPATAAHVASTRLWHTYADEAEAIDEIEAQVDSASGHLGELPLLVVTAGNLEGADPADAARHMELQADLATLSANSQQVVLDQATHQGIIWEERHAHPLAGQIRSLVEELR